jgi:magnesium transporter
MSRYSELISKARLKKTGLPPGTLQTSEQAERPAVQITIIQYNETEWKEKKVATVDELPAMLNDSFVSWINIDGVHDSTIIERIGKVFKIHPLTLEDIMNTDQRPKYEDYDDYDVVMLKMLYLEEKLKSEQLTVLLMKNTVLTFQEIQGKDAFDPVRLRIRSGKGRIRKVGADYLAYALIDSIVDSYFNILDGVGTSVDKLDEELRLAPTQATLHKLYHLKREMIFLRKSVWPMRELISTMERTESPRISESTYVYFRDVLDHSVRVMETSDVFRDIVGGMMDIYHSTISNKMNEVMKVLTSISTIFIPVTFIAGVYGMNFKYMPELNTKWGYFAVMLFMAGIIISLFVYFRRKRWI